MSALMVSDRHIATMVYAWSRFSVPNTTFCGLTTYYHHRTGIARMLKAACHESVNVRYPDKVSPCPECGRKVCFPYMDHVPLRDPEICPFAMVDMTADLSIGPVGAIKAAQFYEHQACEPKVWEVSIARRFVDELISVAIRALPGYADAPWGIP